MKDLEASLPAHSIRPNQVQRIEELEDEIRQSKDKLAAMGPT